MKKAIIISIIVVLALSALMIILALPEAMRQMEEVPAPSPAVEQKQIEGPAEAETVEVEEIETAEESKYRLNTGEVLDYTEYDFDGVRGLTIKVQIDSSWNKEMTVKQNYYNIEKLVLECGASEFDWIQYMASHLMTDGSLQKVISFEVPKNLIDAIAAGNVLPGEYGDYIEGLWLHEELR